MTHPSEKTEPVEIVAPEGMTLELFVSQGRLVVRPMQTSFETTETPTGIGAMNLAWQRAARYFAGHQVNQFGPNIVSGTWEGLEIAIKEGRYV